nr:uncharacterized protein LOC104096693 [Nicotiana tomentosiformis]XP_033512155.1 uncharacterized protein LOC104096693 [Nicotiana tomentosiformis]
MAATITLRSNKVEDVERVAHIIDMVRQVAEQQDENQKAIERISAAITTMKANTEELAEKSEFPQEDNFEEAAIVSQSWLEEQAQLIKFYGFLRNGLSNMTEQLIKGKPELKQEVDQFGSDIHDLQAKLNQKVEASDALQPIVVDTGQLVKQKEEFQLFDHNIINDAKVKEVCKSENVKSFFRVGAYWILF